MSAAARFADTASSHRRLAESADTEHERLHWKGEANRFYRLAELAQTDLVAANMAYRPTRAYDPDKPIVKATGSVVAITTGTQGTAYFNRSDLETAYLLLLEPDAEPKQVHATLESEFGLRRLDAVRSIMAAATLIRHNVEP